jgi:hypothetical protein
MDIYKPEKRIKVSSREVVQIAFSTEIGRKLEEGGADLAPFERRHAEVAEAISGEYLVHDWLCH